MSQTDPLCVPCPNCTIPAHAGSQCSWCGEFVAPSCSFIPLRTDLGASANAAGTGIDVVRRQLLTQALTHTDVERELEISVLAAQIEFIGTHEHARRLATRLAQLVVQRPPEYVAALESALGLSGSPRD